MENKSSGSGIAKLITALIILILVVVFSIQNNVDSEIKLWFWSIYMSQITAFLMCFLFGMIATLLTCWNSITTGNRKTRQIKELEEKIAMLERNNSARS